MININDPRLRFEAVLQPAIGSTFQPTGFPDLGAARFDRYTPDGAVQDALLVESVQSMANRLEATAWDATTHRPAEVVAALPYVRVHRENNPEEFLTSSRLEAHRLASPFVHEAKLDGSLMRAVIAERLGLAKDTPLDYPRMAKAVLALDPFCLIHGVFFSHKEWLGQPKFARAITAVIEAYDVKQAVSGGRKADRVRHQLDKDGEGGGTSEGYGSVPFHRIEWTAREIRAMFSIDADLIRSYGLGAEITELLITLALWEIRTMLSRGLRLRTACDLEVTEQPKDLPDLDALTGRISDLIDNAAKTIPADGAHTVLWKK